MKKINRILSLLLLTVFIFTITVSANSNTYIYTDGNIEIKITHPELSEEKILQIINVLINHENSKNAQPFGLTCTLFGHKLSTSVATITDHMVYDSYPYCKNQIYDVSICERCDYTETILVATERVGCCTE